MRTAQVHPYLNLTKSVARRMPAYVRVDNKKGVVGNGFLEARIFSDKKNREQGVFVNKVSGEEFELEFRPFQAWFDYGNVSGREAVCQRLEARGSTDCASLISFFSFEHFDLEISYVVRRGCHFIQKCLVFRNVRKQARLERIAPCTQRVSSNCGLVLHDAGMYYPVVFVRGKVGGLFYCGDFPGAEATVDGHSFELHYHPGEYVKPGRSFQAQGVIIGTTQLTGRFRETPYHETGGRLDEGERQWFREYLLLGTKVPELPFLELKGAERGVQGVSELELLDQCQWVGARHVFMPRMLQSIDAYPLAAAVRQRLEAKGLSAALAMRRGAKSNLHWVALTEDGSPVTATHGGCLAAEGFRDSLVNRYLAMAEKYGFIDVEVQGAPIVSCHSAGHGHAPGAEAVSAAFRGLVELAEALRENCRHVRCGSVYGSYGAGIVRLFDSITMVAGEHPLPLPDIHVGRLFADMGRLYFRRSHDFLVPKSKLINFVGLVPESCPQAPYPGAEVYPWYQYHDSLGWRYSLISAIATGLRHRFHALPQDLSTEDQAFARKWLEWEAKHLNELMEVEEILDEPGLASVDGYSYATHRGAIVFLFNTDYSAQELCLKLNLEHDSEYVAREIYPREMNYLGPDDGLFRRHSELTTTLGPKEARIIEVVRRSPASAKRKRPEVFGAPAKEAGGAVRIFGLPGTRINVGLRHKGRFRSVEVRMPNTAFKRRLDSWVITQRALEEGLPSLPHGDFPGEKLESASAHCDNVWLCTRTTPPKEAEAAFDTSEFTLSRPCWTYPDRLFFVIRFEPEPACDPIRTHGRAMGVPEAYETALPIKCGIDLEPLNLGLKAWVNEQECKVYPAIAAWKGFAPNPHPVVAYFFEAGSKLNFGRRNRIVLFARHFCGASFRGIYMEHMPDMTVSKLLELE